jgi:hypothetical protein
VLRFDPSARNIALRLTLAVLLSASAPSLLRSQLPALHTPRESPSASVSQVIGMTTVSVDYARPAVNGRKVWGALVPFGEVWRAGANENTVLTVSSPFTVGGVRLPAGRYGLHTIPTASTWAVILSRQANAWGSFSYNPKEDAVRLTVTPQPAGHAERLQYTLDEPTDSSVAVTLRWEKVALSVPLTVPTTQVLMDSLRQQLRDLPYFFAQSWNEAAQAAMRRRQWAQAAEWADSAIGRNGGFRSMQLKAGAIERMGDSAGARTLRERAMSFANEADINAVGYQLLGQDKVDEAIAMFRRNVADYPKSWNVYDSLAEALAKKGDKRGALANYQKALDMVADETQKARIRTAMAALR